MGEDGIPGVSDCNEFIVRSLSSFPVNEKQQWEWGMSQSLEGGQVGQK